MALRVAFMGSPEFALPSLRALANTHNVVGVITQPARAAGRGRAVKAPAVELLARQLKLEVCQPQKLRDPQAMSKLHEWDPELIVVAAYGQILRPQVLDLPRYGCINVHASLLPRWRGAAPIQYAILAGDERTGVTLMKMDAGLDTGPIIARHALQLSRDLTAGAASQALSQLGADLLIETLPEYVAGKIVPKPQPSEGVTLAPSLTKENGHLDFTRPAAELERRVRAMNPWPGAWFEWDGNLLKVARASVGREASPVRAASPSGRHLPRTAGAGDGQAQRVGAEKIGASGSRFIVDGRPAVQSADDSLVLEEVQPAGKKWMSGESFLAGARSWMNVRQ